MPEPITVEHVWEGYRALHRYVIRTNPPLADITGKKMRSGTLPEKAPRYPKTLPEDLALLATRMTSLYHGPTPLHCSPQYFAYLYLFLQLYRCSYKNDPTFSGEQIGWERLGWFPIRSLRGRQDVANAFFLGWYNGPDRERKRSEDELQPIFPMYGSPTLASLDAVRGQLHQLLRDLSFGNTTVRGIMKDSSPRGSARRPDQRNQWHPMFLLSRRECWVPEPERIVEEEFEIIKPWLSSILRSQKACKKWVEEFIPSANLDVWPEKKRRVLATIRDGVDDIVRTQMTGHYFEWGRLKRKFFPTLNKSERIHRQKEQVIERVLDSD
jgi:hypothetical protein